MTEASLPLIIDEFPHIPSPESRALISQLAAFGHDFDEIALMLRLDPNDVRFHYKYEVETGLLRCNAKVAGTMLRNAVAGDFASARFWLINRAGWTGSDRPLAKRSEDEEPAKLAVDDKHELMDRILSMLTPGQVSDIVKAEVAGQQAAAPAKPVGGPPPPTSNSRH